MRSTFAFTERFETPSMIPRAVVRIRVQPCNHVGETTVIGLVPLRLPYGTLRSLRV
jgi:hypothetical protein